MIDKWEFSIPLQKEDLQKHVSGQYSVNELLALEKGLKKSKALKSIIGSQGCISILEHFDTLYSVLCNPDINFLQLQEVYDLAIGRFMVELKEYVQESLALDDPMSKTQPLNVIKMVLYVFSLFLKTYEDKLSHNAENFISEPKMAKKKTIKSKVKPEDLWDWSQYKLEGFRYIWAILSLNINALWPSLVAEEPFINLLANCCYKSFENPDIIQAKNRSLKDTVSQVMAILVSQYNHGMTFISRAVELVKKNENTVSVVSNSVMIMVREHHCTSVLPRLLTEFNGIIQVEDIAGFSKSVSTFITDIAETSPGLLYPCIPILTKNLIVEPYAVRNATLVAFCEILMKCLTGELNEEDSIKRRKLLRYMHNHLRDQNAYVRSKDLQLWAKLAGAHAIPKDIIPEVTETAINRINDKSAFVVKSAVQFFCVVLKQNPFAGKLKISQLEQELLHAKAALSVIDSKRTLSREESWKKAEPDLIVAITKMLDEGEEEPNEDMSSTQSVNVQDVMIIITKLIQEKHYTEAFLCLQQSIAQFPNAKELRCNLDDSDKVEYYRNVLKKVFLKSSDGSIQIPLEFDCFTEEYQKQMKIVEYAKEATAFAKLMCSVCDEIGKVMKGKSLLEVLEAIEFFTTAYQFGLANARPVIREILVYVKCKQPGVKEAVVAAYKTLYLTTAQPTARGKALQIAQRLIKLVKELDYEQKTALEELVQEWVANKELDADFIHVLWEKYSKQQLQTTDEESVAALVLLNMIAGSNPAIIRSNLSILMEVGLSNNSNAMLVTETCNALMKLGTTKREGKYIRYPSDHPIFEKSVAILADQFSKPHQKGFLQMAVAIIKMIFKLSCYPEKTTDSILNECYKRLSSPSIDSSGKLNDSQRSRVSGSQEESALEVLLARLFHVHSEIIFRKWLYFDRDVVNSLKKPEAESNSKTSVPQSEDMDVDEFEGYNREAEDDAIINSVTEICEKLVLNNNDVDSHIRDLVINVCRGLNEPVSVSLQSSAATSLAKLMMVSQEFCENNIQLYFTLMEKSKEEVVRSDLVYGVGDLLCRFPNIIEPWTSHIYARLKDSSVLVRKNTVLVLCHLITREMIKVRGQIAEVCLCLEDPEPSIAAQVNSLLVDLSQKGNTLYNIIVDIISRLSNPKRPDPVSSEAFHRIMKFTLGLIGKERQNELLVEKICVRLKEATLERQWRDMAFCLTQLSYNEKSLRKLCDALSTLNERLTCPEVYSAITSILSAAQKTINKPQLKEIALECQMKLDEILTAKDDSGPINPSQNDDQSHAQRPRSSDPKTNEDNEKDDDAFTTPKKPPPSRSARSTRTRRRK